MDYELPRREELDKIYGYVDGVLSDAALYHEYGRDEKTLHEMVFLPHMQHAVKRNRKSLFVVDNMNVWLNTTDDVFGGQCVGCCYFSRAEPVSIEPFALLIRGRDCYISRLTPSKLTIPAFPPATVLKLWLEYMMSSDA